MLDLQGLKLTFIAGTLGRGGAERQLFYMTDVLRSSGASVEVLSLTRGEHWEQRLSDNGVQVTWVGKRSSKAARLAAIVSALRTRLPDVVQSQHFYTNLYAAVAARRLGLREVGAIRSDCTGEVRINGPVLGRMSLRLPKVLAANSNEGIRNAIGLGVDPKRLVYIRNLVDGHAFSPSPHRLARGPMRLLWVGRFDRVKRPDRFLQIFRKIIETVPDCTATMIGKGELLADAKSFVESNRWPGDSIVFDDRMADPPRTYRSADILVLTSDREGTPNVLLEAMASGLPVVASQVGGVPDIVKHGTTGFLFHPGIQADAVDAVVRLARDASLRGRMGTAARSAVVGNHGAERVKEDLAYLYQVVLAGRPQPLDRQLSDRGSGSVGDAT